MKKTEIRSFSLDSINESYTLISHKSGMKVYILPKDMSTSYCVLGVGCGGMDYRSIKDGKETEYPFGIAHFLEHKLFANEDGEDTTEKFARAGSYCNAYTSYDKTAYLFSTVKDIDKSLEVLINSFFEPYFTKENVKKEASIIAEEAKMYTDDPSDDLYGKLLAAMYENQSLKQGIVGSVRSVRSVTPEHLYEYYESFYTPENTYLCIAGRADINSVIGILDKCVPQKEGNTARPFYNEPLSVNKRSVSVSSTVPIPLFNIGVKIPIKPESDPYTLLKDDIAIDLICEEFFAGSNKFISSLFDEGRVTSPVKYSYESARDIALIILYGDAADPKGITCELKKYLLSLNGKQISEERLETLKKVLYARYLRTFDSTDGVSNTLLEYAMSDSNIFDFPRALNEITPEYISAITKEIFQNDRICVAISKNKQKT